MSAKNVFLAKQKVNTSSQEDLLLVIHPEGNLAGIRRALMVIAMSVDFQPSLSFYSLQVASFNFSRFLVMFCFPDVKMNI